MSLLPYLLVAIMGLVVAGAITMGLAILKTQEIILLIKETDIGTGAHINVKQRWQLLLLLMVFFLGGYSLAIYIIACQHLAWLPLLTGIVFFFGSLFVLFSVSIYTQTLRQLIVSQSNYRTEKERSITILNQLQEVRQTQIQLIHNEKMLSLNQLSAGIAHEINNPIGFIYSNLDHIHQYAVDLFSLIEHYRNSNCHPHPDTAALEKQIDLDFIRPDFFKILRSMETGTQRIRQIVNSMQVFAQLGESQYKQADLIEGLESTFVMVNGRLTDKARANKIQIVKHYSDLPLIDCNHSAINQVFLQILENAIDVFHTDGTLSQSLQPTINVSTQQLDNYWVQVKISDNGEGIGAETLPHIFDPFFTTKPVGQGRGLGLSISYQIVVEQHQGRLQCQSQPGRGTNFTIELPIRRSRPLFESHSAKARRVNRAAITVADRAHAIPR